MLSNLLDFKKITLQGDCRIRFIMEKRGRSGPASELCGTSVKMVETWYGQPNVDKLHERYLALMAGQRREKAAV